MGDESKIRFQKDKWVDYDQFRYTTPRIFEVSRWKDISVKATYRRGSYRIGPSSNGDFRM